MTFHHHGVGSLNSPIVISDDEDEAYVEFALEQRISSPNDGLDDDEDVDHTSDFHSTVQDHSHLELYQSTSRDHLPGVPPHGAQGMFWVLVVL